MIMYKILCGLSKKFDMFRTIVQNKEHVLELNELIDIFGFIF